MRWIILLMIVSTVFGAAAAYREMSAAPKLRRTTDLTAYGRRHGPGARTETATFAAGCFWKLEHALRGVDGVVSTTSGYTGGATADVTHATVSTGRTGHAEAVRVVFDPGRVTYQRLLDVFWSSHDPTRFTPEPGEPAPPGRSVIFFHTEAQRAAAEASVGQINASARYAAPVPTQVLPAATFHRAEAEHQQYHEKHGRAACRL